MELELEDAYCVSFAAWVVVVLEDEFVVAVWVVVELADEFVVAVWVVVELADEFVVAVWVVVELADEVVVAVWLASAGLAVVVSLAVSARLPSELISESN